MRRRRFLGLAGKSAVGSWLLYGFGGSPALAQDAGSAPEQAAAPPEPPPGSSLPTRRIPGINAVEVRLGMSADFSGPGKAVAIEVLRGSLAWLNEVNARGGVRGRRLILLAQDDTGDPGRAVHNTRGYLGAQPAFCLLNYGGGAALLGVLPLLRGAGIPLVGEISGAQAQRQPPLDGGVFCLRPSHRQEMAALVTALRSARGGEALRRFGVFYSLDVHGRSGADAAFRAVSEAGGEVVAEATHRPGQPPSSYAISAVRRLREAGVQVVLSAAQPSAAAELVRASRGRGWSVPVGCGAVLDTEALTSALEGTGADDSGPVLTSRALPPLDATGLPAIEDYRRLVATWRPQPPESLAVSGQPADHLSPAGLEGFLGARLLTSALELAGQWPDRDGLRHALEGLGGFDLGLGRPLAFAAGEHQGLHQVTVLRWQSGGWTPTSPAAPPPAGDGRATDQEIDPAVEGSSGSGDPPPAGELQDESPPEETPPGAEPAGGEEEPTESPLR